VSPGRSSPPSPADGRHSRDVRLQLHGPTIRAITQELDAFASEFATQMEHRYVDNRHWPMKFAMRFRVFRGIHAHHNEDYASPAGSHDPDLVESEPRQA